MRTGAIFARGSCRALKWMALFGVVLFLLAGGEALAQPTSVTTHTMANAYSDQIVVLRFSDPVWGDVPLTAFSHSTATVTDVIGLQESGPGTRTFAIRVATSLATGALGTLTYTQPTEAARRLKTTDSGDADDDPDDVDTFEDQSVTEENNAPVLSESIMDVAVIPDETYDADDPVVELPKVMGASGFGTITYTLEGQATLPAGLVPVATGFDDPTHDDFGKIIGTVDEDVEHDVSVLTWTATDSDTPTENTGTTGRFRIVVQMVPGKPGTLTAAAGDGSVTLSWSAPTTGGPVTSYDYEQTAGGVTAGWMPAVGTTTDGMTVTLTVTGLTNGTDYDFRVRARNTAGPGDASNIASATPAAGPNRTISRVSLGTIGEGGQAQATVTLNAPVGEGQFIRVKLRLVGKLHTRQNTPSGPQTGGPFSATPFRQSGGVRTYLSGELDTADYDADVAGELTIQAGQSSGQVTVYANTDDDAEDEILLLQAIPDNRMFNRNSDSISGLGGREALFHIMDSHTQGYALTAVPTKIYEAGNRATVSTVHFTPNFRRVDDLRTNVTLTSSHSSYSALFANGLNTMALPAGDAGVTAQFQLIPTRRPLAACSCDGDREDDDVVVNAVIRGEVVATTTIEVVDVHKLPKITVTATTESGAGPLTELAEGSKYKVLVEADRNNPSGEVTGETVRVRLALADSSDAMAEDFRITPSFRDISGSSNNQSSTFDLEVLAGDGDIGEEMLVLDATVQGRDSRSGTATETGGTLSVTLVDTTTLNVEPKTDAEVELAVTKARNESEGADKLWTAGDDDLSIMLGDLFKLPSTGFSISADAMSADADVVMAEANATGVTVKAVGPGTTKVTVTATTAATSVSTQVSANIATVAFEVMVDKLDLVLMLSGPEDMNLVEGMEAMLTVTANQKVAEDIEVMIMRDRSKSKAGEDDYDVGMLTIEAGEMSGTTMVMAVEDDMPEDMEELVLYAMAGDMEVDGEVMLYLWDAAVPALPIIAQLLLAGVLGIGGYRRYRRR